MASSAGVLVWDSVLESTQRVNLMVKKVLRVREVVCLPHKGNRGTSMFWDSAQLKTYAILYPSFSAGSLYAQRWKHRGARFA